MAKPVGKARRRYVETVLLTDGHSQGITCVEFNPDGSLVATGALDGRVCFWDSETGKLQHTYISAAPIASLAWIPTMRPTIIIGNKNGNIVTLVINDEDLSLKGFWAHKFPVEHLAFQDNLLASGAHSEVKVWKRNAENEYELVAVIQNPPANSYNEDKEVLATSLHWVPSGNYGTVLLVTYMYHGVQLLERKKWKRVRAFPFAKMFVLSHNEPCNDPNIAHSAAASASQDGKHLAVSNLTKGFDVFSLESGESVRSFEHDVGEPWPTPVLFIHGGQALVGGSTVGKVGIWDLIKGKLSSPTVPNRGKVLAIAAHCAVCPKSAPFRFRIATATFRRQNAPICIIWEALEEKQVRQSQADASLNSHIATKRLTPKCPSMKLLLMFVASAGLLIALLLTRPGFLEALGEL